MIRLHNAESLNWLRGQNQKWDMIFMDPPDNLGLNYSGVADKNPFYQEWLLGLIEAALQRSNIVWISYYWKYDLFIKEWIKERWIDWRMFIWYFRFGQYKDDDCTNQYRPILRLNKEKVSWNVDAIRVESERMRLGDSRAHGPKVPGDVWEFPRITGNNKERRDWCPTQHPEALLERIVKMSVNGGKILDLFCGSGTMIRVVKKLKNLDLDCVELSKVNCQKLKEEHPDLELF